MIKIAILVTDRCQASSIHSIIDILLAANYANGKLLGKSYDIFSYELIGLKKQQKAYNGHTIGPLTKISDIEQPDIVIIPGIAESVLSPASFRQFLKQHQCWLDKLQAWHNQGTLIAATCTGNLLVAAADLAHGRPLTCHWISQQAVEELFPDEQFFTDKMLIDHGDLISVGGAAAVGNFVIYLIEREVNRELALLTGKLMLVEQDLSPQSSFAIFQPNKRHNDEVVKALQIWMEENFQKSTNIAELATKWNISERQLARRFKKSTGDTPGNYVQKLRIEFVKRTLENSHETANAIIWQAGYEDLSSFRRLFKRETGLTMNEYRQRFGLRHAG